MKKYPYKFTKLLYCLIFAGLALCVAAFAVNVYQLIRFGLSHAANATYGVLQYVCMFGLSAILAAILISVLCSSYYAVDEKQFTTSFGFLKTKYDIQNVVNIVLDKNTNKLRVAFKDGSYAYVVVQEQWYEAFVDDILKVSPSIVFEIETQTPQEKK